MGCGCRSCVVYSLANISQRVNILANIAGFRYIPPRGVGVALTPEERTMIAQEILNESGVSLRQIAEDAGVNYGTLRVWAKGGRNPMPENLRQIASGLRTRGEQLGKLAARLERAAEGDGQ